MSKIQKYGQKFVNHVTKLQRKMTKDKRNEDVDQHLAEAVVIVCMNMVDDTKKVDYKSDDEFYKALRLQEDVWKTLVEALNPKVKPFKLRGKAFRVFVNDQMPYLRGKW
jgi:hypothetical protein